MFQSAQKSDSKQEKDNSSGKANAPRLDPSVYFHVPDLTYGAAEVAQLKEEEELQKKEAKTSVTQRMVAEEEEKAVQGKSVQGQEEEELQMKASSDSSKEGTNSSGTTVRMPEEVQAKMEGSFGTSFSDVNIHSNDNSATHMGALAYTQGNNVHFAPGQYNPGTSKGQELLGHELTHVVQQRQGRVQPAKQGKGMPVNDNPSLENEADVMGKKAAEGERTDVSGKASEVQRAKNEKEEETKDQSLVYGQKVSEDFRKKVIEIASELGANPNHLMAIMAFESAGTFSPSIKNAAGSGATGLIQFMPSTAKGLGTTTEELAKMTALEQLEYVRKYFQWKKGKLKSIDDFYMAVLWPIACGKADDYVLFEKDSEKTGKAYTQNKGLDTNSDGKITKAEASGKVRQTLAAGEKLKNTVVESDGKTSPEKEEKSSQKAIYHYLVEKGKGNNTIAQMFGTTQTTIEESNKELHQKRGGKGYFFPGDKIVIPNPGKNLDKLIKTPVESGESKSETNWGKVLENAIWVANPALTAGYKVGSALFDNLFPSDDDKTGKEEEKEKKEKDTPGNLVYTYKVEKGKSNSQIAELFGVTREAIEQANKTLHTKRGGSGWFWAGDKIIIPSPTKNLEKLNTSTSQSSTKEVANLSTIKDLISSYKSGKISMPELARGAKPFALKKSAEVINLYNKLGWTEYDNFSYALANSSSDTELANFDKKLLKKMSSALSTMLTLSPLENAKQRARIDKILNKKVTHQGQDLQKIIENSKTGKQKASEIIQFVRTQLKEYPPKIKAFKEQSNYTDEQKLKIMGKIASLAGRLEILMGSIFYQGSNSKQTWETQGANKGDDEFLKYYQKEQHGVENQGAEWCAMFVASVLNEALGFAPVDTEGKRPSQKGYGWVTWNVTSLHDSITNHAANYKYDTQHEKKITNAQFNTLRQKIVAEKDQKKRYKLVKDFFKSNFTPQSGDLLAVGSKTKLGVGKVTSGLSGFNHSTMIEKVVDLPDKHKIYFATVEGNADQRAGGRLIDLTVSSNKSQNDLSFVTQVSRVSMKNYGVGTNINDGTKDATLKANSKETWTEKDLVNPLTEMANILQIYAAGKGFIQHGDYSESIAEIIHKDVSGTIH